MNGENCCVAGHRDIPEEQLDYVKEALKREINKTVKKGCIRFISGFAQGVDLFFAEIVFELKKRNPHVQLIAAIPTRQRLNSLQKKTKLQPCWILALKLWLFQKTISPTFIQKEISLWRNGQTLLLQSMTDGKKEVLPKWLDWCRVWVKS